ncbi:uncharacterized protein LOC121366726 [Gigantopelta aegis]|uniref:uncharacterized protein LOC121366726 n=1 Tax=Gigantopelta aegis TaxID=1735272 RepID=UPI001B889A31|nr:uncharacterized protein LOC121366726 [Gigantopelta aegis]
MAEKGYKDIVVYLDDFLIIAKSYDECQNILNILMQLLRELGFHINYNKLEGPAQTLTFLGVVLNSLAMTLSIPHDRITELRGLLVKTLSNGKITKRQIQSIVGKLNWITQCVYGGRFFMRCLIDRANGLKCPWHKSRITKDMKGDIMWWIQFMSVFNGTMPMVDQTPATPVSIDACPLAGGAYYCGDFVHTPWAGTEAADLPINYQEVLALEPAVARWAPLWKNKKVAVPVGAQP